jgi:hypothetical protein
MEPIALVLAGGVALLALWVRRSLRAGASQVQDALLGSVADRRGGTVHRRPHLGVHAELVLPFDEGELEELSLAFLTEPRVNPQRNMRLELRIQRVLPELRLSPEGLLADVGKAVGMQDIASGDPDLDRRFVIASTDPPEARAILRAPVVRAIFALFQGEPGTLLWLDVLPGSESGTSVVRVRRSGWLADHAPVRELIAAGEELARALVRAWDGPWVEAAQARGLAVGKLGQRGAATLVGVLEGIPVEARARRGPRGWRTQVTAWVDGPAGLRVIHREQAREEGWEKRRVALGNPVLDMLVAAKAEDDAALRGLLADEAVTEALLPVVHGRRGSTLQHDSVRLVAPGRLTDDLGAAIDDALALARAVRAASPLPSPDA